MISVNKINQLERLMTQRPVLILFGGETCRVCKSILPQITAMTERHFEDIQCCYVDCQAATEICARYAVFSVPAVKVFIDQKLVAEVAGVFSLRQLQRMIDRAYSAWKSPDKDI